MTDTALAKCEGSEFYSHFTGLFDENLENFAELS